MLLVQVKAHSIFEDLSEGDGVAGKCLIAVGEHPVLFTTRDHF
jgi:hypothetical protein